MNFLRLFCRSDFASADSPVEIQALNRACNCAFAGRGMKILPDRLICNDDLRPVLSDLRNRSQLTSHNLDGLVCFSLLCVNQLTAC